GLHARPAGIFAQAAAEQPATVTIEKPGGNSVQASSMLMLMTLRAGKGDEVTLRAEGEGAEEAVAALAALLERDLDAEERAARRRGVRGAAPPTGPSAGDMPGRRSETPDTVHQRTISGVSTCVSQQLGRAGSPARSRGEPGAVARGARRLRAPVRRGSADRRG